MYKNPKTSVHYAVNRDTASYSQTPLTKVVTKRQFQPELLNRSMESKQSYDHSPEQKRQTPIQKMHTYYSQDQPLRIPNYEPTRCSTQRNGIIRAYAANTNQGIVRDYNEDRVSIILNIVKPSNRMNENWPKCSFFGVYDGHGGANCGDFLRDNLHQYVIKEPEFPWNPYEALRKGFLAAEQAFTDLALESYAKGTPERSGSCAIVALIVGDVCYIANVGDSRAILNSTQGCIPLSRDHKPSDDLEQLRIQKAGGRIYQTQVQQEDRTVSMGPLRVLPGRLSVSRTFGDIEAKLERFGGKVGVVVADPELRSFKITQEHDYIALASDGIFDKMSSKEVADCINQEMSTATDRTMHTACSMGVEAVLRESIQRKTLDNITVVVVAFSQASQVPPQAQQAQTSNPQSYLTTSIKPSVKQIPNNVMQEHYKLQAQQLAKDLVRESVKVQNNISMDKYKMEYERQKQEHLKRQMLKKTVQSVLKQPFDKYTYLKHDQENNPYIENLRKF